MLFDVEAVRARYPGRQVVWLDRCETTMAEATRVASAGAPHGTIVGAEEQTAGQGRLGRRWHSEPGSGLYVSMVLRVPKADVLTLALGLAAAEAIRDACGVECDLRWPNDLLIGKRKCAGILVNASTGAYIAGVGVNVNQASFPADLAATATSLRIASGHEQSREALLVSIVDSIDRWVRRGRDEVLAAFGTASSYVVGKRVTVQQQDGLVVGTTDGLDEAGYLWIRKDDGTRMQVVAGGVREA